MKWFVPCPLSHTCLVLCTLGPSVLPPSLGLQGTEMWQLLLQDNVWRPMLSLPGVIYANWLHNQQLQAFPKS